MKSSLAFALFAAVLVASTGCTTLANRRDLYRYHEPDRHERERIAREAKERAANPAKPAPPAAPTAAMPAA